MYLTLSALQLQVGGTGSQDVENTVPHRTAGGSGVMIHLQTGRIVEATTTLLVANVLLKYVLGYSSCPINYVTSPVKLNN